MKTPDSQTRTVIPPAPPPGVGACPPIMPPAGGGGCAENRKTNKPQKTGIAATKRRGGQPGNRNAARPLTALSACIRRFDRQMRAALRRSDAQIAARKEGR